jgi:hypothetical protein
MSNIDHGHDQETQKLWEESEQLEFIKDLKAGKSMAEIMNQPDTAKAFAEKSEELGCSDGRICEHRLGGAGNFILASDVEREKFILENKGKIKVVKSHDGCGAAGIKFKQMVGAGESLPVGVTTADELGIYYCKKLAEALGAEYEHTSTQEMSGAVHNERAIYLDGTGVINPKALAKLPAGFICSGPALGASPEYQEVELGELAKIAFGDHGFGNRFNKNNPLYITVSAKDQKQLAELQKIAERAANNFGGKIKVDGFTIQ